MLRCGTNETLNRGHTKGNADFLFPCGTEAKKLVFRREIGSLGICLHLDDPYSTHGHMPWRSWISCVQPLEVMYQETSNAVMGALLINDLRNPKSASHPSVNLDNPYQVGDAMTSNCSTALPCSDRVVSALVV